MILRIETVDRQRLVHKIGAVSAHTATEVSGVLVEMFTR